MQKAKACSQHDITNDSTVHRITKHTNADLKHFKDYVQLVADNIGNIHCLVSHVMCVQH